MMRSIAAWLLLLAACSEAWGQTPSALATLSSTEPGQQVREGERRPQGLLAGNNPWLLAGEASLKPLAGEGGFSEQWLLSSTKVVYQIPLQGRILGGAQIPVMANLADIVANLGTGTKADSLNAAAQALATGADGLNVGVFPYWPLAGAEADMRTTLFAGAAAKLNSYPLGEDKGTQSLLAGRFSGGIEFALGQLTDGSKPLTITLAGVWSRFSSAAYEKIFDERRSSLRSAELTVILPLRTGAGVLFEGVGVEARRPSFRLGLVLAGGGKAPQEAAGPPRNDAGGCSPNCTITINAAGGLSSSAAVTVTQDNAAVAAATGPCSLAAAGQTCIFRVKPNQPATIKLTGSSVTLGGSGCNALECTLTLKNDATVTVSSTGTPPAAAPAAAGAAAAAMAAAPCTQTCTVTVNAPAAFGTSASVAVVQADTVVHGTPSPCMLKSAGAGCSFQVQANRPLMVAVTGGAFALGGGSCTTNPCIFSPSSNAYISIAARR